MDKSLNLDELIKVVEELKCHWVGKYLTKVLKCLAIGLNKLNKRNLNSISHDQFMKRRSRYVG